MSTDIELMDEIVNENIEDFLLDYEDSSVANSFDGNVHTMTIDDRKAVITTLVEDGKWSVTVTIYDGEGDEVAVVADDNEWNKAEDIESGKFSNDFEHFFADDVLYAYFPYNDA